MFSSRLLTCSAAALLLIAHIAAANGITPNPLLAIDQNRTTVIDRVVTQWGEPLAQSSAALSPDQLRTMLSGLRSDHLLAASLAGTLDGVRDVMANAISSTSPVKPGLMNTKALGDTHDDLVYTPIVPCRILDTRNGLVPPYTAPMVGGSAFPVTAKLFDFSLQGGSASDCGLPASFSAVVVTLTVLNPNFDAFLAASNNSDFATLTQSVVMDFSANHGLANTAIVPVDATLKFYLGLPDQVTTNVIADVFGYFKPAVNVTSGAFEVAVGGSLALQIQPDVTSPILIAGSNANTVTTGASGAAIGGGGAPGASVNGSVCGASCANRVTDAFGTIGGGAGNQAGDAAGLATDRQFATVGGGLRNTASGIASTVAGGLQNDASGIQSTVGGGGSNTASGFYGTVAGGFSNTASGSYSFAAGNRAKTQTSGGSPIVHNGSFAFGDSSNFDFNTAASNEFAARATGGVRFVLGIDGIGVPTWTCAASNGNSWACSSDRNLKENFQPVDGVGVLERLSGLPLYFWNAKGTDPNVRHMGPTAQDFMAAFSLGNSDKMIGMQDAEGVALAAIQGLHQLLVEQNAKVAEQAAEISGLKRELSAMRH